jgi:hypothetical protein
LTNHEKSYLKKIAKVEKILQEEKEELLQMITAGALMKFLVNLLFGLG